ncbi:MAG: rRNA maturation RNase YbeY [Limnochordia bacterium]|nr:rRNA maturation RNase YbeY [Limnochordia bacterium]
MVEVTVFDNLANVTVDEMTKEKIRLVAGVAFTLCRQTAGEVNIVFVESEQSALLNETYRGKVGPTDVLSFPVEQEELLFLEPQERPLGDIVICYPLAVQQAEEYGHSLLRELCFLTAHGCLHLSGYDHQNEEQRQRMRSLEEEVLKKVGIGARCGENEGL